MLMRCTYTSHVLRHVTALCLQTTPGDYLDEGRILAAVVCSLWGLRLPASRYALEALHGIIQVMSPSPVMAHGMDATLV